MIVEALPDGHEWLRVADPGWEDPLDPSFAGRAGGRWNPPGSFPTLYLCEDAVTARLNLRLFIAKWPYEPEDLRDDTGPVLVGAALPRDQQVCDAHSREGVEALGLPPTFPAGVPRGPCQAIGQRAKSEGLRGVRARSAQSPSGAGREVAWFPASARSRARLIRMIPFEVWFWG